MEFINVNNIKENDIVKFINPNRTLFDGKVRRVTNECIGITINTKQDTYIELNKDDFIQLIFVHKHEALKCTSIILGSKQNGIEQVILISLPKLIRY